MPDFNDLEKPGTCGIPNHVNVPPQHVAKMQDAADIVTNFKTLIMRFSARLSLHTGVQTKTVTFEVSRHGVVGSQRMCVRQGTVYSNRVH
jgi:hypothetical protein